MSDAPKKTNADVIADSRAFDAAHARAKKLFMTYPGVAGVAIGHKQTAGQYRDDIAIVVFVMEKRPEDDVPPAERIPPTFEGYPTDVRVVQTSHLHACDNSTQYTRIQGGIQISQKANQTTGAFENGTLACIVRKRNDVGRDNVYLLSNKHVLFQNNISGPGDPIYHPFPPVPATFQSPGPSQELGPIQPESYFGNEAFTREDPANPGVFLIEQYFVDCALARLNIDSVCCDSTCTADKIEYGETIVDPDTNTSSPIVDVNDIRFGQAAIDILLPGKRVFKIGRATGRTAGKVHLTGVPHLVAAFPPLGTPAFTAENTIEIEFDPTFQQNGVPVTQNCKGHQWFSEQGDSGSLIVDDQGRAIGLISAGPGPGFPNNAPDHSCHIVPILDKLNICIPCTTGTSHGSSRATDGSGLQRFVLPPTSSGLRSGQITFTSAAAETLPGVVARPVSDEDAARMQRLLDEFLATPQGPDLRRVFADVRREIGYLIRNSKRVTIAWHQLHGPAFLAHVLNHLSGHADRVPHEVNGVSRRALFERMRSVLYTHGSTSLRAAIDRYGDELLAIVASPDCDTAQDALARLSSRAAEKLPT